MTKDGDRSRQDSCAQNSTNSTKPHDRIRELNDAFRQTGIDGMIVITRGIEALGPDCLLYTSPSPRDGLLSRMPSSA